MIRLQPRSTRTDTRFPYTTLFRSLIQALTVGLAVPHELPAQLEPLLDDHWMVVADIAVERDSGANAVPREHVHQAPDAEIGRAQSELQSLMRISYAVFCLKKKKPPRHNI